MAVVFGLAVGLGVWSSFAIRRTADRRANLIDTMVLRVPVIPGARVLVPWQPVADVDLAHMNLCFDNMNGADAVARFAAALAGTPWRLTPAENATIDFPAVAATDGSYRLRAAAESGHRIDCDTAKNQILVSVEAAPVR